MHPVVESKAEEEDVSLVGSAQNGRGFYRLQRHALEERVKDAKRKWQRSYLEEAHWIDHRLEEIYDAKKKTDEANDTALKKRVWEERCRQMQALAAAKEEKVQAAKAIAQQQQREMERLKRRKEREDEEARKLVQRGKLEKCVAEQRHYRQVVAFLRQDIPRLAIRY